MNNFPVMWIHIDRMRIRIQDKKSQTFFELSLYIQEEKNSFKSKPKNVANLLGLGTDLIF